MFNFLRRSLYLKLLLIYFATAVALFLLVIGTTHIINKPDDLIDSAPGSNLVYYAKTLIKEIGQPVDLNKAKNLAEKLNLVIQIKNNETVWRSESHDMPGDIHSKLQHNSNREAVNIGRYHRYFALSIKENDTHYLFAIKHRPFADNFLLFSMVLILILIVVIGASYYAVRHILKPLKWMNKGVKDIADGNLEQTITTRNNDELGELTQAINQMSQSLKNSIESKEQLLIDVSHELRSPITRIKLALEMMPNSEQKKSVSSDLTELESMITELLESARLNNHTTTMNFEFIDIIPILNQVSDQFKTLPPGIIINDPEKSQFLPLDAERIKIVLRNVFENAIKYSSHQNRPVEVSTEIIDDKFKINVIDYGSGIPVDEKEKIFDPFYRIDKSRTTKTGGYGLGLSLCNKIIQAHSGDIFVNNSDKHGTCITIILPIKSNQSLK